MIIEKRLEIIIDTLKKEEAVSNKILMDKLGVSESTLRRDLSYLQDEGKLTRVHGGAVVNNLSKKELNYTDNQKNKLKEKSIIGKKAVKLIKDAKFIYLDAGSTCHSLIDYLDSSMDLSIVTNGLMHVDKLISKNIPTILLEGRVKPTTKVTTGVKTLESISRYNFDLAFIGANGFDDFAFYTADVSEATVKAKAIENSARAYVLADSSKEGVKYFQTIAKRDEIKLIREDK
ncbi:DeoR/GlpR family DNA-binding transcription regulator [uncultured Anaerococcus sp.]|uniref:DeoR/GlpR family DNA-binding transcription regulator n=1 Tax=uncultured Anaerococcus sp. TaxID=293428 RepID=UPI0025D36E0E|nr:DeoR/GlpR family DNA-binding transcription regulator [uncultured Anaerococcus sp.]